MNGCKNCGGFEPTDLPYICDLHAPSYIPPVMMETPVIKQPKFDAETVIADFLGDVYDRHPRVGGLNSTDYKRLREMAGVLIEDLKRNDITVTRHGRDTTTDGAV